MPVALTVTGTNFLHLTVLYLAAAVPFFLTGLLFSVVFARETGRIPLLYGADLSGGALACLALVPLLNWVGGPNTILFSSVALTVASAVWAASRQERRVAGVVLAAFLMLIAGNLSDRLIDVVYAKGIFRNPAWMEFARWNALSRVEVDRWGHDKAIVIDADASTYIMNVEPESVRGTPFGKAFLMSRAPALANVLRPHGDFAIIGPGGGIDVLSALASGSPSVTGIEINPIIANTIMRGRYATYSKHLYQRPDVHLNVTDGRSYLRSTLQHFDVVQMTLVDTWASTAAGAFALSENNLYTVEAFREYFEHLKPEGMIAITRWEFREPREALRVVAVAMDALHTLGAANPAQNFIVASQGPLNEDGIPVVVLAKRTAFTAQEEAAVQAHFAQYPKLVPIYLPSQSAAQLHNPFADLIASNDPYRFARSYAYNVAPVTDNAPFFFFTLKPGQILSTQGLRSGIDWKVNLGVLVLLLVLIISLLAVVLFLILPLALRTWPPAFSSSALFRSRRHGLHSGGDRIHPALRAFPGTSNLRPDRCDLSPHAVEWRGQPVFAPLASSHRTGLDAVAAGSCRADCKRDFSSTGSGVLGGLRIRLSPAHLRNVADPARLRNGDAISHRPAGVRRPRHA